LKKKVRFCKGREGRGSKKSVRITGQTDIEENLFLKVD
jgi:hypothetical protein